jgi:hypothetical protein
MPIWLTKIIITRIFKGLKRYSDLRKIDKYVNKPNELDKQIQQQQKTIIKQGKYLEEIHKDVAVMKAIINKIK